jgi:rhodanese-related sulfurtransferase
MPDEDRISQISVDELLSFLEEGYTVVDVREEQELDEGQIDGALHMPLSTFADFRDKFPVDDPVIFYCRGGVRSMKAAEIAAEWTEKPLYSLIGGYLAYCAENE